MPEADEAEARDDDDRVGEAEPGLDHDHRGQVGQDLLGHDPAALEPDQLAART